MATVNAVLTKLGLDATEFIAEMKKSKASARMLDSQLRKMAGSTKRVTVAVVSKVAALRKSSAAYNTATRAIVKARKETSKTIQVLAGLRGMALMAGLGMLFFGMQMQRTFHGIIRATGSTFNKIMESTDMMGTGLQQLAVWWEYLKFTIGSALNTALMPLLPALTSLISMLATFISQHPKLVAGMLVFAAAMGSLLFILGIFATPLSTLITGFAQLATKYPAMATAIGGLGGSILTASVILTAFAVLVYGVVDAFRDWKDKVSPWVDVLLGALKQSWEGFKKLFNGLKDILIGFLDGDFERFKNGIILVFNGLKDTIIGNLKGAFASIVLLGLGALKLFANIGRLVLDGFLDFIDVIIDKLKKAWKWLKKIAGKVPGIKGFHTGGTVPGAVGTDQLVMAQGGERIVDQQTSMNFGGITVNVSTSGGISGDTLAEEIINGIRRRVNLGGI